MERVWPSCFVWQPLHRNWYQKESPSGTIIYRPPDMLLGSLRFGPDMDMWSLGCVAAELFLREPLFKAGSWSNLRALRVLQEHFALLGTPLDTIAWMKSLPFADDFFGRDAHLLDTFAKPCPEWPPRRLHCCPPQLADFVRQTLQWLPSERLRAASAMLHPFVYLGPLDVEVALKLEVDLETMSKGSVLLLLTLSSLPRLALADGVGDSLETDDKTSMALTHFIIGMMVLVFGCCCCWAGAAIERRLGDHRQTTTCSVGMMTEDATMMAPQSVWTTVKAGGLPGTGVFHVDLRCGGLNGAKGFKLWRRCFRPECRDRVD
jgi:hypothetical protein